MPRLRIENDNNAYITFYRPVCLSTFYVLGRYITGTVHLHIRTRR